MENEELQTEQEQQEVEAPATVEELSTEEAVEQTITGEEEPQPKVEEVATEEEQEQKKDFVPLRKFMDTTSRLKAQIQELQDQIETSRRTDPETKTPIPGPTTWQELIDNGTVEPDDVLSVRDRAKWDTVLEENRRKRQQQQEQYETGNESRRVMDDFHNSITPSQEAAGLGFYDVFTKDNQDNLTIRDRDEITRLPLSMRVKTAYDKCIQRNPVLKKRFEMFSKKQKPKNISTAPGSPTTPKTRGPGKQSLENFDELAAARAIQEGKTESEVLKGIGG